MEKIFYGVILAVVIGIVFLSYLVYMEGAKPGNYDDFANCLTEEGFVLAGTDWCSYCQKQKDLFGNSFKYLNFKNCDLEKQWCNSNGAKSYPTWIDASGKTYVGVKSLEQLSLLSGCSVE